MIVKNIATRSNHIWFLSRTHLPSSGWYFVLMTCRVKRELECAPQSPPEWEQGDCSCLRRRGWVGGRAATEPSFLWLVF